MSADKIPFMCTPSNPWKPEYGTPVQHLNAQEYGEQEDDWGGASYAKMMCPDCGHRWKTELPQ
jgi:hypothetical protein